MKLVLLIVLYNQDLESSESLKSFLRYKDRYSGIIKLCIWDNSPIPMLDKEVLNNIYANSAYYHYPTNAPLSFAYNRIADNNKDSDYIMIFDQDSMITSEYVDKVLYGIEQCPDINLFIPRIIHNGTVLSPAKRYLHRGKFPYETNIHGIISSKKFIGIMSGMCVRINLITNRIVRFDENLRLYGIDSKFSLDYSRRMSNLMVIDHTLGHNLSIFEEEDIETKKKRFISRFKSSLYYSFHISPLAFATCLTAFIIRVVTKRLV